MSLIPFGFWAASGAAGFTYWLSTLSGSSPDKGYGIAVDSQDNIYENIYTQSQGAGGYDFLFAKRNSSGTIQWQRTLGGVNIDQGLSIAIDSLDNLCLTGYSNFGAPNYDEVMSAKLPSDGSLTGTYELDGINYVYAASSLTASTSSLSETAASLTGSTGTLTDATSTLQDQPASLVENFIGIPE